MDLKTGAIVSVTLQPADRGDTKSIEQTMDQADANLVTVMKDDAVGPKLSVQVLREVVADKGYHSRAVLWDQRECEIRTYVSEPNRERRDGEDKREERDAVFGNRRRIRGVRGRQLMRRRGRVVKRSFAHCYDTAGLRRTQLKKHDNILKRLLVHTAGFNLSLVLRQLLGAGKARTLQGRTAVALRRLAARFWRLWWRRRVVADAQRALYAVKALRTRPSSSFARRVA